MDSTLLRLVIFALRTLSALGHWQATAEMTGRETARAKAEAYRRLQNHAADALRAWMRGEPLENWTDSFEEYDYNSGT